MVAAFPPGVPIVFSVVQQQLAAGVDGVPRVEQLVDSALNDLRRGSGPKRQASALGSSDRPAASSQQRAASS